MDTRQLGPTGMQITGIGLGAWAIGGGGWKFGWGASDDRESIKTIHRALDHGINWIDTAPVYGVGHSEEVVGKALKGRANRPFVFTKCGLRGDKRGTVQNILKAESIRSEVEESLRRLQVDVIDLYQIHWPDPDEDIEEAWNTLAELKASGKVRHIGVSNFNVDQLQRIQAIAPVESLQPTYSIIKRDIEATILPFCQANNIGVIVYSPMMSGLLTGAMTRERIAQLPEDDWRRGDAEYQEPRLTRNMELVERIRAIGARHGSSAGEVAIAWTLHHSAVTGAIVGARKPAQIDGTVGAARLHLSEQEITEIEDFMRDQDQLLQREVGGI